MSNSAQVMNAHYDDSKKMNTCLMNESESARKTIQQIFNHKWRSSAFVGLDRMPSESINAIAIETGK